MKRAYLVVGVPCAGKSWVCNQLKNDYEYVPHDEYIDSDYVAAIRKRATVSDKPLLIETPFSISEITTRLLDFDVVYVFIIEDVDTLQNRYMARENRALPQGHITRQSTYEGRANLSDAFIGTSEQVLEHLRSLRVSE